MVKVNRGETSHGQLAWKNVRSWMHIARMMKAADDVQEMNIAVDHARYFARKSREYDNTLSIRRITLRVAGQA